MTWLEYGSSLPLKWKRMISGRVLSTAPTHFMKSCISSGSVIPRLSARAIASCLSSTFFIDSIASMSPARESIPICISHSAVFSSREISLFRSSVFRAEIPILFFISSSCAKLQFAYSRRKSLAVSRVLILTRWVLLI